MFVDLYIATPSPVWYAHPNTSSFTTCQKQKQQQQNVFARPGKTQLFLIMLFKKSCICMLREIEKVKHFIVFKRIVLKPRNNL